MFSLYLSQMFFSSKYNVKFQFPHTPKFAQLVCVMFTAPNHIYLFKIFNETEVCSWWSPKPLILHITFCVTHLMHNLITVYQRILNLFIRGWQRVDADKENLCPCKGAPLRSHKEEVVPSSLERGQLELFLLNRLLYYMNLALFDGSLYSFSQVQVCNDIDRVPGE